MDAEERVRLTSASLLRQTELSQRSTSISLAYLSMSLLVFSSRMRAASNAPFKDAIWVCWDKDGGGVPPPDDGVGVRRGVVTRRGVLLFPLALPFKLLRRGPGSGPGLAGLLSDGNTRGAAPSWPSLASENGDDVADGDV